MFTVIIALILLYFLYKSPKLFFIMVLTAILLIGIFYVIADISSTGTYQKSKMVHERTGP